MNISTKLHKLLLSLKKLSHFITFALPVLTMEVHYGYENLSLKNPVVTMGVFDGVHLGHRMLIRMVVDEARRREADSVVVTFDPHPRIVLDSNSDNLRFLTDISERIMLLRETGIDYLVIIPFTKRLSNLTACEFIETILCRKLGVKHLISGFDHHFGRRQEGTGDTINECSERFGFTVTRYGALSKDDIIISSSVIRDFLMAGQTDEASHLLGYPYFLTGKVVSGLKIGRSLGFPTANIEPHFRHKLIPANGVYAVEIEFEENKERHIAMLNIGTRPTVSSPDAVKTIEAHVIDFSGDLYNKNVIVRFRQRLRDEQKFATTRELADQLKIDREHTISLLG